MADRVGQQLGNYRLIHMIGEGAFAEVYLGEHIHLGTQHAVKVLRTTLASDSLEEFRTEARTLAHLVHPNIIRVFDFGVEDGVPFLVMDYAPNGTLRKHHPKGVPLPLTTIVSYIKQIAAALQYIHDQKLIHRDIKPENMLVGLHNEILLSDFGIAVAAHTTHSQNTQDVIGTIAYMSPEQLQGKSRAASDQYALGVVVYEWLCGDRPFHGSFLEQFTQHMFAPPPPLHEKLPEISPAIEIVVLTALAKEPQQRFATVQAFANALEQASKFAPSSIVTVPSNPLPLPSPTLTEPTDVISILPTAPAILPTTQPQDVSPQSAQPIIDDDATMPTQGHGRESLIGSLIMSSILSPWAPNQDTPTVFPGEQIEVEAPSVIVSKSDASPPPPAGLHSPLAPDQPKEYRLKEGDTHYKAKRYEEALAAYESVIRMDSQDARAYSNKGNTLRKLKRYEEALAAYEYALTIDPNNAVIWASKGNILFYSLKRHDEALVAYNLALGINPNNAFFWASKGNVLYSMRRYDEALGAYNSALAITLDDASIWKAKGEVLYKQKRHEEALDAYDRALAITPNDVSTWTAKGNKLYKLKRHEEVLVVYDRILAITPLNAPIWSNKAHVLYQVGRYDEALDAYNKVLTITPRKARIWGDKGAVLYKLGHYDEALDAYKFARFLDPDDASIAQRYDMLCDRLRDLTRHQKQPEREQAQGQPKFSRASSDDQPPSRPSSGQPDQPIPAHQGKNRETKKAAESKYFDVFLSHSHTDAEWVEKNLAMRLADEHGFHVWLDKWMLIPGQPFQHGMARGIDQAHCCGVCIGEQTPLGWFKQEIQRALNRQAKDPSFRVFAILLPGAKDVNIDDFLELNSWVDFRSSDTAYAFHVLVSGVRCEPPGRGPLKETTTIKPNVDVEAKLRELQRFKEENWVDPTIVLEFQRTFLKKLWFDFDESKGQQE